jgi:hypothetical protein
LAITVVVLILLILLLQTSSNSGNTCYRSVQKLLYPPLLCTMLCYNVQNSSFACGSVWM